MTASEMAELDRRIADLKHLTLKFDEILGKMCAQVAPEPRKPREFWIYKDALSGRLVAAFADAIPTIPWSDAIRVREVLPD